MRHNQDQTPLQTFLQFHTDATQVRTDLWRIFIMAMESHTLESLPPLERSELLFTMHTATEALSTIVEQNHPQS